MEIGIWIFLKGGEIFLFCKYLGRIKLEYKQKKQQRKKNKTKQKKQKNQKKIENPKKNRKAKTLK